MLQEKDIKILDNILEIVIKNNGTPLYFSIFNELPYFSALDSSNKDYEFERLVRIIDEYKAAKVFNLETGSNTRPVIRSNHNTQNLKNNGGFEKLYQDELIKQERENKNKKLSDIKLYWESKLSKLKYITFWPVFIFGLIGGIYSLYELITSSSREERLNKIEINTQENIKSIKEMRTLVLDQKNQDSLFQTNSDKETSTQKIN